jgi:hypothetical protein
MFGMGTYGSPELKLAELGAQFLSQVIVVERLFAKLGLPQEFGLEAAVDLGGIPNRLQRARLLTDHSKQAAALRTRAWELLECVTRGLMLFSDTLGRASLPTLAMYGDQGVLQRFVIAHREQLVDRFTHHALLRIL